MAKTSTTLFFNSALLVVVGTSIIITGRIWNLGLGDYKFFAGGFSILAGIGVAVIAFNEKRKKR